MSNGLPVRRPEIATVAEVFSEAFEGVQVMIDATVAFLAHAQGAEFNVGSLKWHESEDNGHHVCQLSQDGLLLLQWNLDPLQITSECRWRHLQTVH